MKLFKVLFLLLVINIFSFASSEYIDININKLTKQATKENKTVLLFFHMKYCPYCEKMIDESFSNKDIQAQLKKDFTVVDVNINDSETIMFNDFKGSKSKFSKKMDINFYPTILFLNSDNEITYTLRGYRDKYIFSKALDYIVTKSYEDMSFPDYIGK